MDSHEVRRQWADRSGEYSPEYYAYYGPDDTSEAVRERLDALVDRDARVLELGCSSGRHLAHLQDAGFENLAGIEVNADALAVMEESYPALAAEGTFYLDAIEEVVTGFDDDAFDVVYSVETLQHVHPDEAWVFEELARITGDVLITAEHEGDTEDADASDPGVNYVHDEFPLYYRDWHRVFTEQGLREIEAVQQERDTLRVFRTT